MYWRSCSCSDSSGHHRVWRNTSPCCYRQNSTFQIWWRCPEFDPVEASFAVTLPVQIGDSKTWIEAFVIPGSTSHLISHRWLSQHRCLVNLHPNNLCLESPEFGSVPLVLHSSGHLLLSLVRSSNTLDQYTVMIDCQNFPSSFVDRFQKRDEQTMGSLQPRNRVGDKRAEPDEERAADQWSLVGVILLMIFLCLWMIRMRRSLNNGTTTSTNGTSVETISVQSNPPESPVMSPRGDAHHRVCSCLKRRFVSASTNSQISTPNECDSHSAARPQETLVSCVHRSHQLLHGSNAVSVYLTCLDCRHNGSSVAWQNCNDDKDDVFVPADGWK